MTPLEDHFVIEAMDPRDLDVKLESSVSILIERARGRGDRGIAVIRQSPQRYIVQLDPLVEYGTILERCEWQA